MSLLAAMTAMLNDSRREAILRFAAVRGFFLIKTSHEQPATN
jgi:hypothetical protein